jgi:hypothetical protein
MQAPSIQDCKSWSGCVIGFSGLLLWGFVRPTWIRIGDPGGERNELTQERNVCHKHALVVGDGDAPARLKARP